MPIETAHTTTDRMGVPDQTPKQTTNIKNQTAWKGNRAELNACASVVVRSGAHAV